MKQPLLLGLFVASATWKPPSLLYKPHSHLIVSYPQHNWALLLMQTTTKAPVPGRGSLCLQVRKKIWKTKKKWTSCSWTQNSQIFKLKAVRSPRNAADFALTVLFRVTVGVCQLMKSQSTCFMWYIVVFCVWNDAQHLLFALWGVLQTTAMQSLCCFITSSINSITH